MFPELEVVFHSNYIMLVVWIIVFEMLQDFDFYTSLMKKLLFISHDFNSNILIVFVVKAF